MVVLLVLHVYWFSLIVRVAYAALAKKSEVSFILRATSRENVSSEIVDQVRFKLACSAT